MLDTMLYILLGLAILAPLVWLLGAFNHVVCMRGQVRRDFRNIDVLLRQRFDELAKLMAACQTVAEPEAQSLADAAELRSRYDLRVDGDSEAGGPDCAAIDRRVGLENEVSETFGGLFERVENYPDLLADNRFRAVKRKIVDLEVQIDARRQLFNESVTNFNDGITETPQRIIASLMGFTAMSRFSVPGEFDYEADLESATADSAVTVETTESGTDSSRT